MGSCYGSDVLDIARSWDGYRESGNNWTIFAKVLDDVNYFNGPKQNVAWCGTFTYFCILKACIPEDRDDEEKKWDAYYFTYQPSNHLNNLACACRYGAQYFRDNNAWYSVKDAQRGDVIFFGPYGSETHQGLVDYVDDGRVYTMEGNKGDEVRACSYDLDDDYISGVGRPRYDGIENPANNDHKPDPEPEPEPTPDPEPTPEPTPGDDKVLIALDVLERYSTGGQVNTLKALLKEFEYGGSELVLDGDFDWATEQAVLKFQELHDMEQTGIVDKEFWEILLK